MSKSLAAQPMLFHQFSLFFPMKTRKKYSVMGTFKDILKGKILQRFLK